MATDQTNTFDWTFNVTFSNDSPGYNVDTGTSFRVDSGGSGGSAVVDDRTNLSGASGANGVVIVRY